MRKYVKFSRTEVVYLACLFRQCTRSLDAATLETGIPIINVGYPQTAPKKSWDEFCQYVKANILPSLNHAFALLKTTMEQKPVYGYLYGMTHFFRRKPYVFLQQDFVNDIQRNLLVFCGLLEDEKMEIDISKLKEFAQVRMELTKNMVLLEKYFYKNERSLIHQTEHYCHPLHKQFMSIPSIMEVYHDCFV